MRQASRRGESPLATACRHPLPTFRRLALSLVALTGALLVACGGASGSPSSTATSLPAVASSTRPTAADFGPPQPEADRILEHIDALSEDIGARPSGSPESERAVEYARDLLEGWGYAVEVQEFTMEGPVHLHFTTLGLTGNQLVVRALPLSGSAAATATGPLVDAGLGREGDFPANAAGAVVLIQRGEVTFSDMVRRAEAAGAVGVVVANREPGLFPGSLQLDPPAALPAVAIDQADGDALRVVMSEGTVQAASFVVSGEYDVKNVVARPDDGVCRTYSIGHMDSVPWAPGANDNASGSGLVLDLARASMSAGLTGNCFALLGGEEVALFGSRHLVEQLSDAQRADLRAVLNYDVVASNAEPLITGDGALAEGVQGRAEAMGLSAVIDVLPEGVSSDHRSFIDAGIPAVLITTPDFSLIHTPQDTAQNMDPAFLQPIAGLALDLLREFGSAP